jgi:hypothetical protein
MLSNICELVGLVLIAVGILLLLGLAPALLVLGVELVVLGVALDGITVRRPNDEATE